jgi:hypothetical protein
MKKFAKILMMLSCTMVWGGGSGSELLISSPNSKSVWKEGKSYTIKWSTAYTGRLCIEAAIGGHSKGILNDCKTIGSSEKYKWHIPKGFISDFGINKEEHAKIAIYPKGHWDDAVFSDEFTIIAH